MKYLLSLVLVLLLSLPGYCQDQTRVMNEGYLGEQSARVAVVPFEPRMIISDLHRDMCVKNHMSSQEVREALAEGFFYALRVTAPELAEAEVFGWSDPWPKALESLYGELSYVNTPVSRPDAEDITQAGAFVKDGELRYKYDTLTRYMQPVLPPRILADLAYESNADYVLVISELDLVNLGDLVRVNPGKTSFYVRIHYALYDPEGNLIKGGLVSKKMETSTYDPSEMARNDFRAAAEVLYKSIGSDLFPWQAEEELPEEGPASR